jgi:hypothetical protein
MRERLLVEVKDINTSAARVEAILQQARKESASYTGSIIGSWFARNSLHEWREIELWALKHPKFPPTKMQEILTAGAQDYDVAAALGENPSAPLELLYKVWAKAPDSFLLNPIVQLLQLESPDFWQRLPAETMQALIGLPNIGTNIFEFAVKRFELNIRELVAQHPMTPPAIIEELSKSGAQNILEKVARNPNLSLRALERLLGSPIEVVRRAAAENRSLTPFWAALLRRVRESLYHNARVYPALSDEEFCALARCGRFLQEYITKHPLTPGAVLAALVVHHSREICQDARGEIPAEWLAPIENISWHDEPLVKQVALHPNAPNALLIELSGHFRFEVREAITKRATLDEEVQLALLGRVGNKTRFSLSICSNTRIALSKRRDLSTKAIELLMKEESAIIRENLVWQSNMPEEWLVAWLYDKSPKVGAALVKRFSDVALLQRLTESQHAEVRAEAYRKLGQAEAKPFMAEARASDDEYRALMMRGPYVREQLAQSRHLPEWVKEKLASSDDYLDRLWMAQSPSATPEILSKLSQDKNYLVRVEVAKNLQTPGEVLAKVARLSRKPEVLLYVIQHPNLTEEAREQLILQARPGLLRQLASKSALESLLWSLYRGGLSLAIRRRLAHNKNTPDDLLRELAKERDPAIQEALKKRADVA